MEAMKLRRTSAIDAKGHFWTRLVRATSADELFTIEWEAVSRLIVHSSHP